MKLDVTDQQGARHPLAATAGTSVMELIREAGLPIAAQCGGCCSCATCHVYVDDAWSDRLPPRTEEEDALLELAIEVRPGSRLSCQLTMTPELDGMKVELAPGSEL